MRTEFDFKSVLLHYYINLEKIRADKDRNLLTEDEAKDLLYANQSWLHFLQQHLFHEYDMIKVRSNRYLSKECFLLEDRYRCPGCEDGKPYRVFTYRGVDIPVYDDYGQQDFTIIDEKVISGGSYKIFSTEYFIFVVDRLLERKYLEHTYDMGKEIEKLYSSTKKAKKETV